MALPSDIVFKIFSKLQNACQLLALRSGCKQWRDMIDNPLLFDVHISRIEHESTTNLEDSRVYAISERGESFSSSPVYGTQPEVVPEPGALHSCYGLILRRMYDSDQASENNLYVENPATGSWWELPSLDPFISSSSRRREYSSGASCKNPGIGYDHSSRTFKIVYFTHDLDGFIHTLGSSEWRKLDVQFPRVFIRQAPVYWKGCLHWLCNTSVLSLDLQEEKIYRTRFTFNVENTVLLIWNGSLAVSSRTMAEDDSMMFDVWVLKNLEKNEWNKDFRIGNDLLRQLNTDPEIAPVASLRNGEVILFVARKGRCFIYYDSKNHAIVNEFDLGQVGLSRYRYSTNHFSYTRTMIKRVRTI